MTDRPEWLNRVFVCGWLTGCVIQVAACSQSPEGEGVESLAMPLDACGETVPANRNVDGIPAYAQCDASTNSAIYSNNGVDTSLTSMGADWIKTQYSGGYQCTEFAHRYLYFKWQVKWIPNGNAGEWCDTQPPASSGLVQTTTPVHGDLMVLAPGSCGAAAGTGHVNVVDVVDGSGRLTAVEQNRAGRSPYMRSCGKCFLHVVANDGAATGSMIPTGSGGAGAAGMGMAGMGMAGMGAGGAAVGSGGRPSAPMTAPPQAGAPAPNSPAIPAAGAPAPTTPALAAPTPSPDNSAMSAGSGGATSAQPVFSDPPRREAASAGCSVARNFAPKSAAPQHVLLGALALIALRARSRRRRSRVGIR